MKKLTATAVAIIGLLITSARAQTGNGGATKTPSQVLLDSVLNTPSLKDQEVKIVLVTLLPGETGAAHFHLIPAFGYVLEGQYESTFDGKVYIHKAGDAFYEEPNKVHQQTRTIGDKPAKFLAIFIGDKGKPSIAPMK
jgi:quercetin dioxygenase-like cupin family protein